MSVYLFTVTRKTVVKVTITPNLDDRDNYDSDLAMAEAEMEELIASGTGWWGIDYVEVLEEDESTKVEVLESCHPKNK